MKTISIRELHAATGKWVRCASVGAVHVTERGRLVAKIVPAKEAPPQPFFAAPPHLRGPFWRNAGLCAAGRIRPAS